MTKLKLHSSLIVVLGVLLSACAGSNNYQAKDKSEDYLSARALPPLIKTVPSVSSSAPAPQQVVSVAPVQESAVETSPVEQPAPIEQPVQEPITWSLLPINEEFTRIQTNQSVEQAWAQFATMLTSAAVTIIGRNASDNEYRVNCIDALTNKTEVKKESGWSVFKKQQTFSDVCRFVFEQEGERVLVSYVAQNGEEVPSAMSLELLERIIN
jgi:hypothetical protein